MPVRRITSSVIWGTKAPRTLFGAHGVRGLANVEITPEFAVNLAAAYGATLKSGPVLVSRDYWRVSHMIHRVIVSWVDWRRNRSAKSGVDAVADFTLLRQNTASQRISPRARFCSANRRK